MIRACSARPSNNQILDGFAVEDYAPFGSVGGVGDRPAAHDLARALSQNLYRLTR